MSPLRPTKRDNPRAATRPKPRTRESGADQPVHLNGLPNPFEVELPEVFELEVAPRELGGPPGQVAGVRGDARASTRCARPTVCPCAV